MTFSHPSQLGTVWPKRYQSSVEPTFIECFCPALGMQHKQRYKEESAAYFVQPMIQE